MKKIIFIGVADKTHVLLVLGRLLTALGNKVLVVDSTVTQSIRGYLPHAYTNSAIQEYEGMDVAYGYLTPDQLERGLAVTGTTLTYDVMLLDTDHSEFAFDYNLSLFDKRVWCWDGKRLSLQKNEELMLRLGLQNTEAPISFFELLSPALPGKLAAWRAEMRLRYIQWEDTLFRFPLDERDAAVDWNNQHHGRIDLRGLTGAFREMLLTMLEQLTDCDRKTARRAWSIARKKVRVW
ncbi:hypothetical protein BSK66_24810 [Paenibacillus odorifer]|uniref:hypothetical protein n=1 Tax=Paenibacillus TaxID=44249 RepID=UPI0003E2AF7A|nr:MULTISPECIES: hypothetical protein [Paenibacillus]ETT61786.1 hypothetical protein C171_11701 [Paenibacillus sp. FSL H8-237]OME50689.1 hypothetical protein BSK66_24810 [Paenibacillus odorifer]SIR49685.1 hypothetical protein SAMN05880555_3986 [Paenibacillus sp. RU4X]SIR58735.1 hypothetical protein SAMN05880570_3989 [Paenibacillus sp. RU4T]